MFEGDGPTRSGGFCFQGSRGVEGLDPHTSAGSCAHGVVGWQKGVGLALYLRPSGDLGAMPSGGCGRVLGDLPGLEEKGAPWQGDRLLPAQLSSVIVALLGVITPVPTGQ